MTKHRHRTMVLNEFTFTSLNWPNNDAAQQLCLSCGLCCNGVIFADVQIESKDEAKRLKASGLTLQRIKTKTCLAQPCGGFQGGLCSIYAARPAHCRNFECSLLLRFGQKQITLASAQRVVRKTQKAAEKAAHLLRDLGNEDEHVALSHRFQATVRQMENSLVDKHSAALLGELTLAMHELNITLGTEFYP